MRYPPAPQALARAALAIILVLVLASPLLPQDDAAILERILADWRARQERAHTARYVCEGETLVPRGTFTGDDYLPPDAPAHVPEQDYVYPTYHSWDIDFDNHRVRHEVRQELLDFQNLVFAPDHRVHVFDGERMRVLDASARLVNDSPLQPDFYDMGDSSSGRWFFVDLEYPLLFAHGIFPFNGTLDLRDPRVDPATLDLHFHGRGLVHGRECIILRTPATSRPDSFDLSAAVYRDSFKEIWVDLERESAIVRWYNYTVGRLHQHGEIAYEETADGWLPESWIHTTWHFPDGDTRIIYSARLQVTERSINEALPAALFELEPRAGMIVEAPRGEDLYRVGDDGESRIDIPRPWEEPEASGAPWGGIVAIALGAAAATLTLRVIMARKRRASQPRDSTGNAVP